MSNKSMRNKAGILGILLVVLTFGINRGWSQSLYVYEPFAYSSGSPLSGQNGGTGFSGGWTLSNSNAGSIQIGSNSLAAGALSTQGNDLMISNGNYTSTQNYYTRSLTDSFGGTGQDIWISFLLQPGSTNYGGLVLGPGSGATVGSVTGSKGIFIGYSSTIFDIGANGNSSLPISGGTPTLGVTQFIVANLSYTSATGGTITLYLNATPGGSLGVAAGSASFILNSFNQISFTDSGAMALDEIRIGDSYLAVSPIPEPGTYVLLGIGLIIFLFIQFHRQKIRA